MVRQEHSDKIADEIPLQNQTPDFFEISVRQSESIT